MNKVKKIVSSDFSMIAIVAIVLLSFSYFDGRFSFFNYESNPSPMLILAVIVAAYRGIKLALFSAALFIGLYFINFYVTVDQQSVLSIYDLKYLKTPILILILSIIIGELKQRTMNHESDTKEMLRSKESVLKITRDKNNLLDDEIKSLRKKLIFKRDSFNILMDIDDKLSNPDINIIASNFNEILKEHFYIESSFLLISIRGGEELLYDKENKQSEIMDSSLFNRNIERNEVYEYIKPDLVLTEQYEGPLILSKMKLDKYGSLIFAVNKISFLHLTKQNVEGLQILLAWFRRHLVRNLIMKNMIQNLDVDPEFQILKKNSFRARFEDNYEQAVAFNGKVALVSIRILSEDNVELDTLKKLFCVKAKEIMRGMDIIGEGADDRDIWICYISGLEDAQSFASELLKEVSTLLDLDISDQRFKVDVHDPLDNSVGVHEFLSGVK
tara:strand:- start:110773 stop:112098 length:1326 start_codon:yes stop_codon:yes gene_type:complete